MPVEVIDSHTHVLSADHVRYPIVPPSATSRVGIVSIRSMSKVC
jgi:hypothetical protein